MQGIKVRLDPEQLREEKRCKSMVDRMRIQVKGTQRVWAPKPRLRRFSLMRVSVLRIVWAKTGEPLLPRLTPWDCHLCCPDPSGTTPMYMGRVWVSYLKQHPPHHEMFRFSHPSPFRRFPKRQKN